MEHTGCNAAQLEKVQTVSGEWYTAKRYYDISKKKLDQQRLVFLRRWFKKAEIPETDFRVIDEVKKPKKFYPLEDPDRVSLTTFLETIHGESLYRLQARLPEDQVNALAEYVSFYFQKLKDTPITEELFKGLPLLKQHFFGVSLKRRLNKDKILTLAMDFIYLDPGNIVLDQKGTLVVIDPY